MDIASLIANLEHLAERMNMTFPELLNWVVENNLWNEVPRDPEKLPWED